MPDGKQSISSSVLTCGSLVFVYSHLVIEFNRIRWRLATAHAQMKSRIFSLLLIKWDGVCWKTGCLRCIRVFLFKETFWKYSFSAKKCGKTGASFVWGSLPSPSVPFLPPTSLSCPKTWKRKDERSFVLFCTFGIDPLSSKYRASITDTNTLNLCGHLMFNNH